MKWLIAPILFCCSLSALPAQLRELERCAQKEILATLAERLERRHEIAPWPKGKMRCGESARAILELLAPDKEITFSKLQAGSSSLAKQIAEDYAEGRASLYYCDTYRLDHVFVIALLPNKRFYIMQSFVNRYSLAENMKEARSYSLAEVQEYLVKLQELDEAVSWDLETATLYQELFNAPCPEPIAKEYSEIAPDFAYTTTPL